MLNLIRGWKTPLAIVVMGAFVLSSGAPLAAQGGSAAGLPLLPAGTHVGIVYTDPQPEAANALDDVFGQTIAAGVDVYELSLYWSLLEPQPGMVDTSLLTQFLAILDRIDLIPYLGIQTIDTVRLAMPPDLVDPADPARLAPGLSFDDPALLARWGAVLDAVVPLLVGQGGFFLSVGNEVDPWLAAHPDQVEPFLRFVDFSREHVQALAPQMGVGVTITAGGVAAGYGFIPDLLARGDAAVFTYYPLNADYTVRDPSVVAGDVAGLVGAAGNLPVLLQEAGYPSGYLPEPSNGSSVELQRQFVAALFEAVSAQPQIRMVSFLQLSDWPEAACDYFLGYYGSSDPVFREYLCSLGLYTYDEQAKPAYAEFLAGLARLRGG